MGGIIGGIMTPTEAAVAGAVYAFLLGVFVYREIKVSQLPGIFLESAVTAGMIAIIVAAASPIGWVLTFEQAAGKAVALINAAHLTTWQLYLVINIILIALVLALVLMTYIPSIAMWLPNLLMPAK